MIPAQYAAWWASIAPHCTVNVIRVDAAWERTFGGAVCSLTSSTPWR